MRDEAREIRRILSSNKLSEAWISQNTALSAGRVYYILGDACKNFDIADYEMIMTAFDHAGYLSTPPAHSLKDHGLQLGCVTSAQISEITHAIMMIENHENIPQLQREKLRNKLLLFKQTIDNEINLVLQHLDEDYRNE